MVRSGPPAARPGPRHGVDRRPALAAAGRLGHHSAGPRDPRRPRHRLGRGAQPHASPPSCSPRPTCGCSSPRRRATPTRSRGSTSSGPPSARPRSRSCSTGRRPSDVTTVAAHLARMLASRGLKDSPLFTVAEGTVSDGRPAADPAAVADVRAWLVSLADDAERPLRRRAPDARRLDPYPGAPVPTCSPTPTRSSSLRPPRCARPPRRRTTRPATRSERRRPTARCCAARCSPGGRSSSAPASCCARSSAGSAGSATASSTPSRAAGQQAERVAVAIESAVELMVLDHAEAAAARDRGGLGRARHRRPDPGRDRRRPGPAVPRLAAPRRGRGPRLAAAADRAREGRRRRAPYRPVTSRTASAGSASPCRVRARRLRRPGDATAGGAAVLGRTLLDAVFGAEAVRHPGRPRPSGSRAPDRRPCSRGARPLRSRLLDALGLARGRRPAVRAAARRVDDRRFEQSGRRRTPALIPSSGAQALGWWCTVRRQAPCSGQVEGEHDVLARGGQEAGHPRYRDRCPHRGTRRRRARLPADASTTRSSTRPQAVVDRAAGRLRLSATHTVVAIAGATGSGKSSTFNALTGLELSAVGVRRPTTSWATACVWGREGADELLEWLGIPPRHQTTRDSMLDTRPATTRPSSTASCCSTFPTTTPPRSPTTSRSIGWSTSPTCWCGSLDPQKYADAAIHDRYLAPSAEHQDVMLVVLNHIDTVPEERRQSMLDDVRRLLDARRPRPGPGAAGQRPRRAPASPSCGRDRAPGRREAVDPGAGSTPTCAPSPAGSPRSTATRRPARSAGPGRGARRRLRRRRRRARRRRGASSARPGCAPTGRPAGRSSAGSPGSSPTRSSASTSTSAPTAGELTGRTRAALPEATQVQRARVDDRGARARRRRVRRA